VRVASAASRGAQQGRPGDHRVVPAGGGGRAQGGDRVVALVVDDGIAAQLGGQPQPPASSAVSGTIVAR